VPSQKDRLNGFRSEITVPDWEAKFRIDNQEIKMNDEIEKTLKKNNASSN
jgi:hypothetical protein